MVGSATLHAPVSGEIKAKRSGTLVATQRQSRGEKWQNDGNQKKKLTVELSMKTYETAVDSPHLLFFAKLIKTKS